MKTESLLPATVVFGSNGFIGRNLFLKLSESNPRILGVARNPMNGMLALNLLKPDIRPLELKRRGVSCAIIAAAISKIGACETDPILTRRVNVQGTVELAAQLCDLGIKVITFSSDYVFDGATGDYTETSHVAPVNEYGRQKVEMERLLLKACGGNVLILRLSKVFDIIKESRTLLDEMAGKLSRGETVIAARDQIFCPVWMEDIADFITRLMVSDASGIVHLCAPKKISRLELARSVAAALSADPSLVKSISLTELGENFLRPLNTSMVCQFLDRYLTFDFTDTQKCINQLCGKYKEKTGG